MTLADLKLVERRALAACARGTVIHVPGQNRIINRVRSGPRGLPFGTVGAAGILPETVTRAVKALVGHGLVWLDGDAYRPTDAGRALLEAP
jgi:hypothetical protein